MSVPKSYQTPGIPSTVDPVLYSKESDIALYCISDTKYFLPPIQ